MGRGAADNTPMPESGGPASANDAFEITTWIAHDGVRVLQIDSSPEIDEDSDGPRVRIYLNDALVHGAARNPGLPEDTSPVERARFALDIDALDDGSDDAVDGLDEGYDVYLYADASEAALEDGSDKLVRGFPYLKEAIAYADEQVASGEWKRAIVGEGESVYEHYDTAHGRL